MDYYKIAFNNYIIKDKDSETNINIEEKNYKLLKLSKEKIDTNKSKWETNKKYINMYEYIYTSSNNVNNISNFYPISRSYFKLIEIMNVFNFISHINHSDIICLCEAPGGFIQCITKMGESRDYKINSIHTITLNSDSNYIPYWSNHIINDPLVNIHTGIDGTGDIFKLSNVLQIIKDIPRKCMLITGDGGFDYSIDYNNQEQLSYPLIYSEIMIALSLQKDGGGFICKIFDIFFLGTFQLLYLLVLSYDEVYLYKPKMSRLSNSEKYIVCKGFKGYNKDIMNILIRNFKKGIINIELPEEYIRDIKTYNNNFVNMQIINIEKCFQNIKYNNFSEKVEIATTWCQKYNVPVNNDSKYFKNIYRK